MEVFISFHQRVVDHVVYPHHVQVLGISRVHGFEVATGDIEVEYLFGVIGWSVAGRKEQKPPAGIKEQFKSCK